MSNRTQSAVGRRAIRRAIGVMLGLALAVGCAGDGEGTGGGIDDGSDGEAAGASAPAAGAATGEFEPTFTEVECSEFVDDPDGVAGVGTDGAECGYVEVPLHHDEPDGDTIALAVAILPAADPGTDLAPVMVLAGGPGEVFVSQALSIPGLQLIFSVGPETILFDQRGAGVSRPALDCPEITEGSTSEVIECQQRLEGSGIDLQGFNTPANAADVDLIRRALGHDRVNLWGTSYGSLIGQLVAEQFPESVDALVLSSPIDPNENWMLAAAEGFDRALRAVDEACARDATCSELFDPFDEQLAAAVSRLEEEPQQVTVTGPDGQELSFPYSPQMLADQLFAMFYVSPLIELMPALIAEGAAGDFSALAQLGLLAGEGAEGVTFGMQLSMLCSGVAAELTAADVSEARTTDSTGDEIASDLVREYWASSNLVLGEPILEICDAWDVEQRFETRDVDVDLPTLVVTGRFDQATQPRFGEQVADRIETAHLIEVPVAGHAPLEALGPCAVQIVSDFLADPDTAPDDACATELEIEFSAEPLPPELGL